MNLASFLEVLNANKDAKVAFVGMKGKPSEAVVADNLVKVSLVAGKKESVANLLAILGKLDAGAGNLEVSVGGKVLVSADADEGYVVCKVS